MTCFENEGQRFTKSFLEFCHVFTIIVDVTIETVKSVCFLQMALASLYCVEVSKGLFNRCTY